MRIAMLLPVADCPATRAYALWTRSARDLSEALVQRGIEVTGVPIQDAGPRQPTYRSGVIGVESMLRLTHVFQNAENFDLIHDMIGFAAPSFAGFIKSPMLSTVWFDMWQHASDMYQAMNQQVFYLSPGEQDRKTGLLYTDTLPWGVAVRSTPFHPSPDDHLVFLGALEAKAGVEEAIQVANQLGRPLVLLGTIVDRVFFDRQIAPHLGAQLRHHEDPASPEADRLIGQAACVLHVGNTVGMKQLALLDAMARGVPVLAIDDSHGDIVVEGITGAQFVHAEAAVAGFEQVIGLDRKTCRNRVLQTRALLDMVDPLLHVYERVIVQSRREEHRPWGYYVVLADEPDHKVKRLVVYPGKRLSLQRHRHRSEHWFVLEGEAMVVQDDEEVRMLPGQSIEIPKGCWHRIRNPGMENLAIIEVQTGEYFGEEDIERKEDDFGRAPPLSL